MIIEVIRCDEAPEPYVPSVRVRCRACGADCWLSKALSQAISGDMDTVCECCLGSCVADEHGKPDR